MIPKSTSYTITFKMISSTDHISLKTSASPVVNISKAGGAFAAAAGTVTEIANGWYKCALTTADTNTLGDLSFYITGTGADDTDFREQVGFDPTAVDANALLKIDLVDIAGSAVSTTTAQLGVNVVQYNGQTAATDANNLPKVDAEDWKGGTIPAVNVTGVPLVDLKYTLGALSPAAAGSVSPDWGQVVNKTSTVALTNTTISTSQTITSVSGSVGSVTGAVGSVTGAVGSVTAAVTLSAGDSPVVATGTATAGGASTITLQTALGADNLPNGCTIKITSGTGQKQARVITGYVDATKVVTVDRAWTTNPDATSVYAILYTDAPALSAGLKITEVSLVDTLTTYTGNTVQTGDSFARLGAPAGASIAADLAEIEGETDGIAAIPTTAAPTAAAVATAVWQDLTSSSDFTTASSIGKLLAATPAFPTNFASMSIDANGRVEIQSGVTKNVALNNFEFLMVSSTDHVTAKTGLTVTAQRSLDGAAFAACANAVTELSNGIYTINLAAGDLNAGVVTLRFSATGADDRFVTIRTTA